MLPYDPDRLARAFDWEDSLSIYTAPRIPGWRHFANSAAATAEEALADYAHSWPGKEKRAEPFTPDSRIRFALYFKLPPMGDNQ